MIIAALVLIGVAVGVVLLTRDSGGGLDAAGAADGLEAVIDDADFADGTTSDLRRCSLGDEAELAERVAGPLDLDDELLDEDADAYVFDGEDFPTAVWCTLSDGDPAEGADVQSFSLVANELPRADYDDFLEDSASGDEVDIEDPVGHRGGEIYAYCVEPADYAANCGADWVDEDNDLAIGLNYTTDEGDPGPAVDALKELLPDMIANLADEA